MPTEMELTLEQTQQGVSYEVSVFSDIEDSHGPSDAMHNPLATQGLSTDSCFISHGDYTYFYRLSHSELVDIEKVAVCSSLRSLKQKRFDTSAGNHVKEILLKLSLPDHRIFKDGGEDSEDSTITYTAVSSLFGGLSDIGSSRVNGPPVMPKDPYAYVVAAFRAPPSPDYVSGLEYPPSPDIVPELVYPEFMPLEDEVLPVEEHPLPDAVSLIVYSPDYVPESDLKEDPEVDDDEDPEEDPADYPDDDVDIDGDEEEEHPAHADSTVVALPTVDQAPSAEETEPFETDKSGATPPPHPAYRVTARISIRDEPPMLGIHFYVTTLRNYHSLS
ncbi:hypothetical protein Tco_1012366 [Tanacetum coccineum]